MNTNRPRRANDPLGCVAGSPIVVAVVAIVLVAKASWRVVRRG